MKRTTAPYKYPRIVEFVDALPKTISDKIQRNVIRARDQRNVSSMDTATRLCPHCGNENSRILILGSMPSVMSLRKGAVLRQPAERFLAVSWPRY